MSSMEALPDNCKGGDEEGKPNINNNGSFPPIHPHHIDEPTTIVPTENVRNDHTIEGQKAFDEMTEGVTTHIDETPAGITTIPAEIVSESFATTIHSEIVSKEHVIEERDRFVGVAEGLTTHINGKPASLSTIPTEIAPEEHNHVLIHGMSEILTTRSEETTTTTSTILSGSVPKEDITGAQQVFDRMSEDLTAPNDATATVIFTEIVPEEGITVEQQVFDGMSEGLANHNNGTAAATNPTENTPKEQTTEEQDMFDGMSEGDASEDEDDEDYDEEEDHQPQQQTPRPFAGSEEEEGKSSQKKKQKPLSSFTPEVAEAMSVDSLGGLEALAATPTVTFKKSKKKKDCVWTKSTSRKGKKKSKLNSGNGAAVEDTVLITPVARFPDRSDDSADMKICLSKMYKAEKVELSEDRLSAGSSKGYRMVRATRGVVEGAWYFEIKVSKLGETGHTRLGWSMEKGDLQAPVGYDANSFGYRDIDGSKVHKAMREKYGDAGYGEGDTIGFYINLPDGAKYAPKPPQFVWYKGQKYMCAADGKEEAPKVVPGSEISFFKNGVCQGIAFKDLYGGRYYPAASMYTLPNQPNCVVKFNFGPDFDCFPQDFDSRPLPSPMVEVPYIGFDCGATENGVSDEKKS